jgi:CBS domain containing-hemolysin-like protein
MREPLAVPESALLGPLLSDFRGRHTHMAIVVDEHGGIAGIVSLEDLLEELVGEIRDEYDRPEPAVLTLPDGNYLVPGSWRLDETRRDTGVQLPPGEYETLSGLIMAELDRVPAVGDVVELEHARLRVDGLAGHAVGMVHLTPLSAPVDDHDGDR